MGSDSRVPVIIDGHNLIGKMSSISLSDPEDEEKLINLLARHLLHNRQKTIVVFDKGTETDFAPQRRAPRLSVIFAPPESSADAIIIDMIKRDPNPKGLTVVSSDNEIRRCARSRRSRTVTAEVFARELDSPPERKRRDSAHGTESDGIDVDEWIDYFRKGRT
jgi:predicted RNA-binding protein with PIN domain